MKLAYTKPAQDEMFIIGKNDARRLARTLFPGLSLMAFQTMHSPRMSIDVPYVATFSTRYIRILSIPVKLISDRLIAQFRDVVLPYVLAKAKQYCDDGYHWPQKIYHVSCMEGGLFPSLEEILKLIKKEHQPICRYDRKQSADLAVR